jgi:hypothetical protein
LTAVDELGVADEDCVCGKFRAHNSTDFLVFFFLLNAFRGWISVGHGVRKKGFRETNVSVTTLMQEEEASWEQRIAPGDFMDAG